MCTITEHFGSWTMNIESDPLRSTAPPQRVDRNDDSVDSRDVSLRSGTAPEELPKGYHPRPADVCCGRGKKNWRHHGNATFRRLIHSNVPAYMEATTKHDKTLVVKSIVDIVRSNGGRFLKQANDGSWYDIGDSQAKEKVGHSLRDQVTALSKQKKDSNPSATPRRSSVASYTSPLDSQRPRLGRASLASSAASPAESPLGIMSSLPSDLSGILEHIHFPSIQASGPPPLEASSSSLTTAAHQSFNTSQNLHTSQNFQTSQNFNTSQNFDTSQSFSSSQYFNNPSQDFNSSQNFNSSISQGMPTFFQQPLEDVMEPTPIREVFGPDYAPSAPDEERGQPGRYHYHHPHHHHHQP